MTWLMLSYFLSIGTLDYSLAIVEPHGITGFAVPQQTYQTTLGIEALIAEHFFIGAKVQTWEQFNGSDRFTFAPMESLYTFTAGVRWNGLEIGFAHECDHITVSSFSNTTGFLALKTEWYLSYTGKLKVF